MRWILLAFVLFATQSSAQTPLVAHLAHGQKFNESAKPNAPVAGHFDVVGASLGRTASEGDATNLYVRIPADWKGGPVCVEMTSRNGLYEAADVFDVPTAPRGTYVKLDFTTRYPATYATATRDTFAVSARTGPCSAFGDLFLAVAWALQQPDPDAKILLAIQTGRSKVSALIHRGSSHDKVACAPINAKDTTAFDAICPVPLGPASDATMTVQIERCSFGECSVGETIRLGL